MKKRIALMLPCVLLACASLFGCTSTPSVKKSLQLTVMTYNLRFAYSANDAESNYGGRPAEARMAEVMDLLKEQKADIVFLNEAARYQDELLQEQAEAMGYGYLRVSDFSEKVENYNGLSVNYYQNRFCNYILYRSEIFTVKDTAAFSVSDSPERLHSFFSEMSSDACWSQEGRPRVAVWALLGHKESGLELFACCAHTQYVTDDNGTDWNAAGKQVLAEQIALNHGYFPDAFAVFGGDMNSEDVAVLEGTAYTGVNSDGRYKTYGDTALDHIFHSMEGICQKVSLLGNEKMSDHLALLAELRFER